MRIVLATIALLVCVGFIVRFIPSDEQVESERKVQLGVYGRLNDFAFTDETGQPFSSDELEGKVWLANFVFTSCTAECPILTQRVADVREKLQGRDDVAFLSFSVDPQTDTPERLAEYARPYGADARWKLLTGDPARLESFVKEGLLLPTAQGLHERSDIASAHFIHSNKLIVVDGQGTIRFFNDGLEPDSVDRLTEAMTRLLAEGKASEA